MSKRVPARAWSRWLLAAAWFAAAPAFGQADCSKLEDELRPRCENVNRMRAACAGLESDELKRCERDHLRGTTREDCSKVPPQARSMCEAHNRAAAKAERCKGMTGAAEEACLRDNATRPGMRQF